MGFTYLRERQNVAHLHRQLPLPDPFKQARDRFTHQARPLEDRIQMQTKHGLRASFLSSAGSTCGGMGFTRIIVYSLLAPYGFFILAIPRSVNIC